MNSKVFVIGHRNPDVDSLVSAAALAELRRRGGMANVEALCPGNFPERAKYLFKRFGIAQPRVCHDIYLRVSDIMDGSVPTLAAGTTLFEAVGALNGTGLPQLPVVDGDGRYVGMLNPLNLLSKLLDIGRASDGLGGRRIHTSIDLIAKVLHAEVLVASEADVIQDFQVYVSAMSIERFGEQLPKENRTLAVISGDRPDIHLKALQRQIRLLIVTGNQRVEDLILKEAKNRGVSILRTSFDSAAAIRRLKFSVPVEFFGFDGQNSPLGPGERLASLRHRIMAQAEDVLPVVDKDGKYLGSVMKRDISAEPPYSLILVDHNEIEQGIHGVEDLPVIEVVDHHRIGMPPTANPIKFTGDVVGSTCTLVAMMYRSAGESLTPGMAGLLLGGIVADTLNLKSPTTAETDRKMATWLEKISGVTCDDLMAGMSQIDSPLASQSPEDVINSDRKSYVSSGRRFALSQVEETNFALLHQRKAELEQALRAIAATEQLDFIALMVTDAVRENSELLVFGKSEILRNLPYRKIDDGLYALPGILSRKKQLLPQMLATVAME